MYIYVFIILTFVLLVCVTATLHLLCQKRVKKITDNFTGYLQELDQKNEQLHKKWKDAEKELKELKKIS